MVIKKNDYIQSKCTTGLRKEEQKSKEQKSELIGRKKTCVKTVDTNQHTVNRENSCYTNG